MPARYHPLYDGVWNHPRLEGVPFEELGFFIFLFGNTRQRPSGIYRITDEQAAADTGLSLKRVTAYMADLTTRHMIVRDGAWIFVTGYFKRQPKQGFLLKGVEQDVTACTSVLTLKAFGEKYSHYKQWSVTRLATIGHPTNGSTPTDAEQMQMQSRADAEQKKLSLRVPRIEIVTGFSRFWAAYPKRLAKEDAGKAWKQMACEPIADEVLAGLHRTMTDLVSGGTKFIPYPGKWLRAGRWKDEPTPQVSELTMHNLLAAEAFVAEAERMKRSERG